MEPKYITVPAMISFDEYPTNDALLLAVQDAWHDITENYSEFIDPESGRLSLPLESEDGKIVYVYTMTAYDERELILTKEDNE